MTILILLISISLALALLFLGLFIWSMRSGQYEDSYTPSLRILIENKDDLRNADKLKSKASINS